MDNKAHQPRENASTGFTSTERKTEKISTAAQLDKLIWKGKINECVARNRLYQSAKIGCCTEMKESLEHLGQCEKNRFRLIVENALYESTKAPTADAFDFLHELLMSLDQGDCKYARNTVYRARENFTKYHFDTNTDVRNELDKARVLTLMTQVVLSRWQDRRKKLAIIEVLKREELGYIHPVVEAVIVDDIMQLEQCCLRSATANFGNEAGLTLLQIAAANNSLAAAEWLLQHGSRVSERRNIYGSTALLFAAKNGHLPMCEFLLSQGASLTEENYSGFTALLFASHMGHLHLVEFILSRELDVDQCSAALHFAASGAHEDVFMCLTQHGASINTKNTNDNTVLELAMTSGSLPIVSWILGHGIRLGIEQVITIMSSILAKNSRNYSVLSNRKLLELIEYFFPHAISLVMNRGNENTNAYKVRRFLVETAILTGKLGRLDMLKPIPPDIIADFSHSLMLDAAEIGFLEMILFIMQYINTPQYTYQKNYIDHALQLAVRYGHEPIVRHLLEAGGNLESKSYRNDDRTAVLDAFEHGHLPIIQLIQEQKVNFDVHQTKNSQTPLHLAAYNGHLHIVKWIVKIDANQLKISDKSNQTVIDFAGMNGHLNIIKWVTEWASKDDYEYFQEIGENALYWAARHGDDRLVTWLLGFDITQETFRIPPPFGAIENGDLILAQQMLAQNEEAKFMHNDVFNYAVQHGQPHIAQHFFTSVEQLSDEWDSYCFTVGGTDTAIGTAAMHGHLPTVQWLLSIGASLQKVSDDDDMTPFLYAVSNGKISTAQWLLNNGARKSDVNKRGMTAFTLAILELNIPMLQLLLGNNVPMILGANRLTPVFYALRMILSDLHNSNIPKLWSIVYLLLRNGAELDGQCSKMDEYHHCKKDCGCGYTVMHFAAREDKIQAVRFLRNNEAKYDLHSTAESGGYTPLHCAALYGNQKIIEFLLMQGASLQERDADGNTVLLLVAYQNYGYKQLNAWLLGSASNVYKRLNMLKWLLNNGSDIRETNSAGQTIFDILLTRVDASSKTSLNWQQQTASRRVRLHDDDDYIDDVIDLLKESKESIQKYRALAILKLCIKRVYCIENNYKTKRLDYYRDNIIWLLQYDVREDKADSKQLKNEAVISKAIAVSVVGGDIEMLRVFLTNPATIDWCDEETGGTLLHFAGIGMNKNIVELLLINGAVNLILKPDRMGKNVLDIILEPYVAIHQRYIDRDDLNVWETPLRFRRQYSCTPFVEEKWENLSDIFEMLINSLFAHNIRIPINIDLINQLHLCAHKRPYQLLKSIWRNQLSAILYSSNRLNPCVLWDTVVDYVGDIDTENTVPLQLS